MTTESENIIPTPCENLREAGKIAEKVRKATIIARSNDNLWQIIMLNKAESFEEDLNSLNLLDGDGVIMINDLEGEVARSKIRLNSKKIKTVGRLISRFNSEENPLINRYFDIEQRFKKMVITPEQLEQLNAKQEEAEEEVDQSEDLTGAFEVSPIEFICYFDRMMPSSLIIDQEIEEMKYKAFRIYLGINTIKALNVAQPLLRKASFPIDQIVNHINQGGGIELCLKLKDRVLEKAMEMIEDITNIGAVITLMSPLRKPVFTDLLNYDIEEVNLT